MNELKSFISNESDKSNLSIRRKCELLELPRSSFYREDQPESKENLDLMKIMDQRHLDHPTHGVLQMQDYLFLLGFMVNHKRVRRLLRKMGIMARYPIRNLSKRGHVNYIRPYLLRNLGIDHPNHVWAIDITFIPMRRGFMYLVAIIDVYSRFVVGWDIFNSLDAANSLEVLKSATARYGKPEIVNSDQGSQYTSSLWVEHLDKEGILISMDGKGRALDNIFIERLWRTVKQDYVYQFPANDGTELFLGLKKFFHFYNHEKTHQGIDRERPVTLYLPAA